MTNKIMIAAMAKRYHESPVIYKKPIYELSEDELICKISYKLQQEKFNECYNILSQSSIVGVAGLNIHKWISLVENEATRITFTSLGLKKKKIKNR